MKKFLTIKNIALVLSIILGLLQNTGSVPTVVESSTPSAVSK